MTSSRNSSIKVSDENEYSQDESYDKEPYAVYPENLSHRFMPTLAPTAFLPAPQPLLRRNPFFGTANNAFCILVLIVILQGIFFALSLALDWFLHCFWYFSLYGVTKLHEAPEKYSDRRYTLSDLYNNICNPNTGVFDDYCPDLCKNISHLENSRYCFICFGSVSMICAVVTLIHLYFI